MASALSPHFLDDLDPIDMVEHIAQSQDWEFNRVGEDQLTMMVEGQWRTYSLTLAWSAQDETLRLISSFDLTPPEHRITALFEILNGVNENCWSGFFTFWGAQNMMVYRYALGLSGGQRPTPDQIDTMICEAILACEQFYPAFQMAIWGEVSLEEALQTALMNPHGSA